MILIRPSRKLIVPTVYNGTSSITTIAANPTQELSAQSCLASLIIRGGNASAAPVILTHADASVTNGFIFRFSYSANNSTFRFQADSTGTAQAPVRIHASGAPQILNDTLYNVAFTWDGGLTASNIHLYTANPSSSANKTMAEVSSYGTTTNGTTAVKPSTGQPIVLGNRSDAGRPFNGEIFYIARWNRVLSVGELDLAQYNPLLVPGLTMFWVNGRDIGPHGLTAASWAAVPDGKPLQVWPNVMQRNLMFGFESASSAFNPAWAAAANAVISSGARAA